MELEVFQRQGFLPASLFVFIVTPACSAGRAYGPTAHPFAPVVQSEGAYPAFLACTR